MMRLFIREFGEAYENLLQEGFFRQAAQKGPQTLTIATGKLAYSTVKDFAKRLMEAVPGLTVHVYAIRNDFFGETITVSGLITGRDLITQLKARQEQGTDLGDRLLIPSNMLRSGEQVFLDDATVADAEKALNLKVAAVEPGGEDFIRAVLETDYAMERENENFVYIKAYENT